LPAPRILIIRLSALGDVVMASGLIPAIRALHPEAHLAWLTEPPAAPLLQHNPGLNEVIVWPKERWKQLWKARQWGALLKELRAFRHKLRSERFDLVLDAQGLLKSGVCAWLTGAPRRIGLLSREGSQFLVHETIAPPTAEVDDGMSREYRFLAQYLGAPASAFWPSLVPGQTATQAAQKALQAQGLGPSGSPQHVVIAPFTTRAQKHWFNDHWQALISQMQEQGLAVVMLGGPSDTAEAAKLTTQCPGLINLVGQLKLNESAAVIASSRLMVGVDTGLTHMGTAFKRPTVALFGSTRPYLDGRTPSTHVMYDALSCSPCRRHPTCAGRFDCMRQLTPQRVWQSAQTLMELHA
jgi:heptosyltransferase-1